MAAVEFALIRPMLFFLSLTLPIPFGMIDRRDLTTLRRTRSLIAGKCNRATAQAVLRLPFDIARDCAGSPAVEFALVGPVLLLLMFGIVTFGIAINNYIELTDAVRSGGRTFAISRSSSTPYTSTTSAITSSAPNLTAAKINTTMTVNGTACASDSACSTALSTAAGGTLTVRATYPCNLTVMSVNYAPGCTLTATTTELIE